MTLIIRLLAEQAIEVVTVFPTIRRFISGNDTHRHPCIIPTYPVIQVRNVRLPIV